MNNDENSNMFSNQVNGFEENDESDILMDDLMNDEDYFFDNDSEEDIEEEYTFPIKAKVIYSKHQFRYFDKNGNELFDNDVIVWDSGKEEKVYLTKHGCLGTDATNPCWIEREIAGVGECGIYPLNDEDLKQITKKVVVSDAEEEPQAAEEPQDISDDPKQDEN